MGLDELIREPGSGQLSSKRLVLFIIVIIYAGSICLILQKETPYMLAGTVLGSITAVINALIYGRKFEGNIKNPCKNTKHPEDG